MKASIWAQFVLHIVLEKKELDVTHLIHLFHLETCTRIRPSTEGIYFCILILLSHCRKELIAQYSRLSEEAARRERRAMWRVQRMRLNEARAQFFILDRQKIQVCCYKNRYKRENFGE